MEDAKVKYFYNKFIQVTGNTDSGKTKFILDYIRRYQNEYRDNIVFYVDIDHDLVLGYLNKNSIDLHRFFYGDSAQVLMKVLAECPDNVNLVVVDSLPMIGRENNVEVFLQKIRCALDTNPDLSVICVNQYRHDIRSKDGLLIPWYNNVINKYVDINLTIESGNIKDEIINTRRKTAIINSFTSFDNNLLSMARSVSERALFVCK